ncbi:MAG: hypothetical protein PHH98_05055 [Candidatus Gracilibacteria bacterium]|nr:hypothetical protein [Candidatus Gracilibacteria bacterium]
MAKKGAKIMAVLALLGIIVSILGTGLIVILQNGNKQPEITQEQYEKIQQLINSQSGSTSTGELNGTGNTIEIK